MASEDIVRVLRLVEYEGPRSVWFEEQFTAFDTWHAVWI